jgi:hypothetical protein
MDHPHTKRGITVWESYAFLGLYPRTGLYPHLPRTASAVIRFFLSNLLRGSQPIPHGIKSLARWVFWKMFRNVLRLYVAAETGDSGRDSIFSQNLFCVAFK